MRSGRRTAGPWSIGAGCIALALAGCSTRDEPHLDSTDTGSVAQFGFAHVDCGYDDPTDSVTTTNYLDEVASFTNVAQLCAFDPDDQVQGRLDAMSRQGVRAHLSVQDILFTGRPDSSTGSGSRFTLRQDAGTRWNRFVEGNALSDHLDSILAFYVADEPIWNGITFEDLDRATELVKGTFPQSQVALVEASPAVADLKVPTGVDLLGFDHYAVADPRSDAQFQDELRMIKAKRSSPHQRLILVMDAQWLPFYQEGGYSPAAMKDVATHYFDLARTDPDVVALVGYTWPNGVDDPAQLGVRGMPSSVRQEYERIGAAITGKTNG